MQWIVSSVVAVIIAAPAATQIPGSFRSSSVGCPDPSLLYEQFDAGTFDLSGAASIDWVPNGAQGYIVLRGVSSFRPTTGGTNLFLADNAVSAAQNLGFSHPYPRGIGSTTQIEVSSNGYVYLEPGTILTSRCCNGGTATFAEFRADTPSWAVFGMDLDPGSAGDVWFNTAPGQAWVTWQQVPEVGQTSTNTFQIQFDAAGQVSLLWQSASNLSHETLIGWSGGNGVEDNGPFDFSMLTTLYNMGSASGPLTISAPAGRLPTIGQTFQIDVSNVTPDAVGGALMLGGGTANIDLTTIGMLRCNYLISSFIASFPLTLNSPAGSISLPLPNLPQIAGFALETQAVVVAPSVNTLGVGLSNRGTLKIGDSNPVVIRAEGLDNDNDDTSQGFWKVINGTLGLDVTRVQFDWVGSSTPNTYIFDTNETGMADRFDGGNSSTPLCQNTYRNDSDAIVGLDYGSSILGPCGANHMTGWVGSNYGKSPGDFRTLDFRFLHFQPGEVFEFDADTDGGPGNGGAMAGMVVTVWMSDGSVKSGQLQMIDANTAEVAL